MATKVTKASKKKARRKRRAIAGGAVVTAYLGAGTANTWRMIDPQQKQIIKIHHFSKVKKNVKKAPGVKAYLNNANNRAHKWNQEHARPFQMAPKKHTLAKREVSKPVSSRRVLLHGSDKRYETLKPQASSVNTLFGTTNRQVAEHYAMGGYGAQSKKRRNKGYVHAIDRSENHKFIHTDHALAQDPSVQLMMHHPDIVERRRRTGHSFVPEHSAMADTHAKAAGGYWVHRTPNGRVNRYHLEPHNHRNVAKRDAVKVAVGAAAVGGLVYGGYRLHKHFHERHQAEASKLHNPYYTRHTKMGKTIRVRNGRA